MATSWSASSGGFTDVPFSKPTYFGIVGFVEALANVDQLNGTG
jgi:hypothetical protein